SDDLSVPFLAPRFGSWYFCISPSPEFLQGEWEMKRILALLSSGVMVALAVFTSAKTQNEEKGATLPPALGAIHPGISPDGKTIAVSYLGAIWTLPAGGGVMTRLTDGKGFDHEPAWSPDGKRIAYVRGPNQLGGNLRILQATDGKDLPVPEPVNVSGTY